MSGLAFLGVALAASVVGSLVLWLRSRKPRSFMSSIDEFHREMSALGGQTEEEARRARERPDPIVPAESHGDLARKLKDARRYGPPEAGAGTGRER